MSPSHFSLAKIINWIICFVFLLFAYVQFNDPDPFVWVAVYGVVALLFALANFVKIPKIVTQGIILALGLFALFHAGFFYDWMLSKDKSELFGDMIYNKPYIEGTREFMGLLIAIGALMYLQNRSSKIPD